MKKMKDPRPAMIADGFEYTPYRRPMFLDGDDADTPTEMETGWMFVAPDGAVQRIVDTITRADHQSIVNDSKFQEMRAFHAAWLARQPVRIDYTRDELIDICERAIVPVDNWANRDSLRLIERVGVTWALLRAGCPFEIHTGDNNATPTDKDTIWFDIRRPTSQTFEIGDVSDHSTWERDVFYLPTLARIEAAGGEDWY